MPITPEIDALIRKFGRAEYMYGAGRASANAGNGRSSVDDIEDARDELVAAIKRYGNDCIDMYQSMVRVREQLEQ